MTRAFALVGVLTPAALTSSIGAGSSLGRPSCPVTVPSREARAVPPAFPAAYNYGNASLRVELSWPKGTLTAGILPGGGSRATINPDGSIRAKLGWWRGVPGQLIVWGRRLDLRAPPLRAEVGTVASYGHEGFVPSALIFSTVGCWRVVGGVKHARLSFVVTVTKIRV